MSVQNTSENIKRKVQKIKEEMRGSVNQLGGSLPKPLQERKTVILREPIIKMVRKRMEKER